MEQFPLYPIPSTTYALNRPEYPASLFHDLAQSCARTELVWEVGCGTGHATKHLASHFDKVCATDASSEQISKATPLRGVSYLSSSASVCPLANDSVDLVFTAQALHWFDRQEFVNETVRALKAQGTLAYLYYSELEEDSIITSTINKELTAIFDMHGPTGWKNAYESPDYTLPFERIEQKMYSMDAHWSLLEFSNYLHTRFDVISCMEVTGVDPTLSLLQKLSTIWFDPESKVRFRWPITLCTAEYPHK